MDAFIGNRFSCLLMLMFFNQFYLVEQENKRESRAAMEAVVQNEEVENLKKDLFLYRELMVQAFWGLTTVDIGRSIIISLFSLAFLGLVYFFSPSFVTIVSLVGIIYFTSDLLRQKVLSVIRQNSEWLKFPLLKKFYILLFFNLLIVLGYWTGLLFASSFSHWDCGNDGSYQCIVANYFTKIICNLSFS
ncbi:hypothetical protein HELRODRAFT_162445 [Helobdella robusta]|uniref:Uncharacterized protein n=1 Tax=Helobdella robusta TaxID=6412 RepID=T1ESN8_HELRO|nr:hypothetical protein HELRODRAFT_162445 [Helobdella robusta]ESN98972.1 hypothetical protein HELRODRAFT_162445 [Helobdella robusta]